MKHAWALLDCGAEGNFVDQKWVKEHLPDTGELPRRIHALDGHKITSYSQRRLKIGAVDRNNLGRESVQTLEAVDIAGYDIILGYPWLRDINPDCDWENRTWAYREVSSMSDVELINSHKLDRLLRKGNSAYIVGRIPAGKELDPVLMVAGARVSTPEIPINLRDFADVFSEKGPTVEKSLHIMQDHDHAIDLFPGKEPPHKPLYNLSEKELSILREYLDTAMEKGWIHPSKSPAGAPIFFVPQKDGSMRLCVDYRGLNAITIKNRYPLPLISETLDRLAGAKIFTQLDLRDGYHHIRIRKGDEWKTAFRTRYGHFEYHVMPFGLANAPATFQAYINKALSDLLDTCCVVYLDDILIYSSSPEEHEKHVRLVLERLRKFRLFAKLSKCSFGVDTVHFLGFVISPRGIEMEKERIATIESWPEPTCVRDIQVFLGFANFYRRFIQGYARITAALSDLTKGADSNQRKKGKKRKGKRSSMPISNQNNPFVFTKEARDAFEKLKSLFSSAPLLRHFNPRLRIRVEPDASKFALGAILTQLQEDDQQWHPVAYFSRKLLPAEANYETYDSEMLAIVAAFKQWRHYLEGSRYPVTVLSDHANLRFFMTTKELNGRQTRWAEKLSAFDFIIEHRPGKNNPADAPSRRPDYAQEFEKRTLLPTLQEKLRRGILAGRDLPILHQAIAELQAHGQVPKDSSLSVDILGSCGQLNAPADESLTAGDTGILDTLVPRLLVAAALVGETAYSDLPQTMVELMRLVQQGDAFACEHIHEVKQSRGNQAGDSPWSITGDGLLRYKGCVYVPKDHAVREEILRINHDDPQGAHFGRERTLDAIRRKYFWHGMAKDIREYVKTCDICQRVATHRHKEYGMLEPLPKPKRPFETITLDFITGLPPSRWRNQVYDAILVVVDAYTKYSIYIPCRKDIDASALAELLLERVFGIFGMPKNLVSDRGSIFTSKFWSTLCYCLGVKRRLSTAFHPQSDGQTERQNQMVEHFLRCYTNFEQDDWGQWLPLAQFTYNNSKHSSTGVSPAEALMGFRGDLRIDIEAEPQIGNAPRAIEHVERLKEIREMLEDSLVKASAAQKKYYDRRHQPITFAVGDKVMLRAKNIRTLRPSVKLDHRQLGPFTIIDAWGQKAYKLSLPPRYKRLHPVFHVSLLEPYHARDGAFPEPAPIPIDGEDEWLIESIQAKRTRKGKAEYLVRWTGYSPADDSWEPAESLADAEALDEFEKRQQPQAELSSGRQKPRRQRKRR
jgi:hypothetical protein